jgi:polar amino acid transport system permease protein
MKIQLDFGAVLAEWPILLQGVGWTMALSLSAVLVGTSLGILFAWVRAPGFGHAVVPAALKAIVSGYVESIRNTPFIIQLFFIFFGLPAAGLKLSAESASFLAMTLNLGAYATEIIRAGLEATPKGQIEAAKSLALNHWQLFTRVVLPPAMRKIWPSMVGQSIIVMLGSSVCGQISIQELSYAADLIQSRNFRSFESFIIVGAIYLMLSIFLRATLNWAGEKLIFGGRSI